MRSAFVSSSCSVTSIPVPTNPWNDPAVCRWRADAPDVTNRSVRPHDPLREVESAMLRQHRLNFLRDEVPVVRMHERHVFRDGRCVLRGSRPWIANNSGDQCSKPAAGKCPAARMRKPLSLRQVELGLLAFFDVEVDPDPVEDRSVVPSKRFRATEEPAVVAFSVTNPKAHLTRAAGAQTV